ncbi:M1 family aminopeptidase [Nocardioides perillae]|uniref:Aminopeptidase N n=1 Tax=Nocardioides perillae TaxID=1119534 RepID=A0A7Y9RZN1_9ACTN|nr:aminopeptidase N [Nocardioides perillae]
MGIRTRAPLLTALLGLLVALVPLLPGGAAAPAREPDLRPRPGAETAGDPLFPASGNGGYHVRHHDLRMRYHPATRRLVATATLRVRTTQPLSRLSLDLRGLQVTGVRVAGEPARWSRAGAKLRVVPPRPLAAGRTVDVRVSYRGRPGPVTAPDGSTEGWIPTDDGAVALNQPVGAPTWHPTNATPADESTYDVRVNVPRTLQAVSTGRLVSRRVAGGLATWHWRTSQPTPAALSMLAIGRFRRHDARVVLTSGTVPAWSFTDVTTGDAAAARGLLQPVLRWLEDLAGPYPFDAAGLVVDVHDAGYALETQTRPVFPGRADETTLVHELAHQWFGGSVTPRRWSDTWLSEGWATYAEWLWNERPGGDGPTAAARFRSAYTSRTALDRFWEVPPGALPSAEQLYHEAVYLRGAMTLHALRERVGEADFAAITRTWTTRHRHRGVTTATFERLAEEVSGEQLDTLFQDWLREPTRPAGY